MNIETVAACLGDIRSGLSEPAARTTILAELLRGASADEIGPLVALCIGDLTAWKEPPFGDSDSPGILARSSGSSPTVRSVYSTMAACQRATGAAREYLLGDLVGGLDETAAGWIQRLVAGRLAEVTTDILVLEALRLSRRDEDLALEDLKKAYSARANLPHIAHLLLTGGPVTIRGLLPKPGIAVYPESQTRRRQTELAEIWASFGACFVHPKLDGFRCQIHKDGERIWLFVGRNMREWTDRLPAVALAAREQIDAREAILESEVIPVDPESGVTLPRRNFHRTSDHLAIVWDALYLDGHDLRHRPYAERAIERARVIREKKRPWRIRTSCDSLITSEDELHTYFNKRNEEGDEGIIIIRPVARYSASLGGVRSIDRIKVKAVDPIDAVVVGYDTVGRGGAAAKVVFHLAVYDRNLDAFVTIGRSASGLTQTERNELFEKCQPLRVDRHSRVLLAGPVQQQVAPKIVVELEVDYVLPSKDCSCGLHRVGEGLGAQHIRFVPGGLREDKGPEQATEVEEFLQIRREPASPFISVRTKPDMHGLQLPLFSELPGDATP